MAKKICSPVRPFYWNLLQHFDNMYTSIIFLAFLFLLLMAFLGAIFLLKA